MLTATDEDEQASPEDQDEGPRPIGIDLDREIVPFQLGGGKGGGRNGDDDDSTLGAGSNSDADLQDDAAASDDDDYEDEDEAYNDNISQSPPTSLPLLSIDLVELTGCTPSNAEEKTMLVEQVRGILVGPSEEQNQDEACTTTTPDNDETKAKEEEPLWAQFNAKSVELFNMGAASHADTSIALGGGRSAPLSYRISGISAGPRP